MTPNKRFAAIPPSHFVRLTALENYVYGSTPAPFNKTQCLARGAFNVTFAPDATSKWVVVNFNPSGKLEAYSDIGLTVRH